MRENKKKKFLIIGYGSIGRLHAKILNNFKNKKICVFTSQKKLPFKTINRSKEILSYNPDYIVVSNNTFLHEKYINLIEKNFRNKLVLVEKPLLNKFKNLKLKKNKFYVAYNLRFHPIIKFLKNKLKNRQVKYVNINCSSYLPAWRKNISYTKSVSASKKKGGGVLLELSHELDYFNWIFGNLNLKYSINKKLSNLKIDTDDTLLLIGKVKNRNTVVNITMNFFSKVEKREIQIESDNLSMYGDLRRNFLKIYEGNSIKTLKWPKFKIYETYKQEHLCMIKKNFKNLCNISQGLEVLRLIEKIRNFR